MRRRQSLLHEEIIRVAAVAFSEMGYRATTLEAIAAKVGISKVTLYKHVPSKQEMLCRVFERTVRTVRAGLRQIVEQPLPADEKLRRILRYQVTLLATDLPLLRVFFSEEANLPPAMARRIAREKREYDHAIEAVVREGTAAGRLRALPSTLTVFCLLGACNWLHKWYRPEGPLGQEEIATVFVDLLERGYLAQEPERDGQRLAKRLESIDRRLATLEQHLRHPETPGAGSTSSRPARGRRRPRDA
jgi:TetR/AcrR family transcriptional regulator, cholesterol catabolism regulator